MVNERIQFISHKGRRLLALDYSGMTSETLKDLLPEVLEAHKTEPLGSILVYLNCENLHFSPSVVSQFNSLVSETKKYVKATAIVGVKGLIKVMYDAVAKFTKLDMKTFDNKEVALDWLVTC